MSEPDLMEAVEKAPDAGAAAEEESAQARKRPGGVFRRLGRIIADQAIPLAVGAVSFVIAVDAWLSAKPLEWEQQRALASVEIASEAIATGEDENSTVTTITIENVGALTFAILDLHLRLELVGDLSADWEENSLVRATGSALPIGLRPFRISDAAADRAQFQFDERAHTWHVVDPGRSVAITFVQPTRGSGWMATWVNLFTQPIQLGDLADEITLEQIVDGVPRATLPESGEGEVSKLPVFPYSAGSILIIPNAS